ncbi:diacylglycerol kinase family lipid kinase [Enterococcus sp. BWR-S5]|nr:diacylglycerol kinase family protein [Enterococcus sp. BWR-S5]MBL1225254.1 diacylglycerol kinase family lipid kinase [Enterococcus sp. BWR-S5]
MRGEVLMKVLLAINPSSGGEQAKEYQELAEKSLKKRFDQVTTVLTEGEGDATRFAKQAAEEGYDAYFVMGGDGTVNEGISGLAEVDERPAFGFFPLGTVNDLARALGISMDPKEAIQQVVDYQTKKLDIGKINQSYFMNVVAIGAIPETLNETSVEDKTKFGKLAYVWNGLKSFMNNQAYDFRLVLDGKEQFIHSSTLIVGLTNSIGGFEQLLPNAEINDGLCHLVYLKDGSKLETLQAVPELLQGVDGEGNHLSYQTFKEGTIELVSEEKLQVNVDGDPGDELPIKIRILSGHLDVYCPAK